jgi:hypothetical protein
MQCEVTSHLETVPPQLVAGVPHTVYCISPDVFVAQPAHQPPCKPAQQPTRARHGIHKRLLMQQGC